ncbi:hypothetical protein [Kitasatospora sp. McL0602]|uniref:hypothetical protein n=1 Tax=Kitasatospora sp. McL0602 TaxID=3439530 RepID=UPI003F8AF821
MRIALLPATVALAAGLTLAGAGPALAHGDSIHLAVANRGGGQPSTVATWEADGDPVTETLAATLSAVSADGHRAGPWQLEPVPGSPATFATAEALPVGTWHVTVEAGFPALGREEADITVGPPVAAPAVAAGPVAAAGPVTAGPVAAASAPAAPVAAAPAGRPTDRLALVVGGILVAAVAAAFWAWKRGLPQQAR